MCTTTQNVLQWPAALWLVEPRFKFERSEAWRAAQTVSVDRGLDCVKAARVWGARFWIIWWFNVMLPPCSVFTAQCRVIRSTHRSETEFCWWSLQLFLAVVLYREQHIASQCQSRRGLCDHGWRMPYGWCGRCHTNFARATPTFCPFIIISHTNFDLLVSHIMFWPHQLWKPSSAHVCD